ncbi:transglutaminase family protein [Estrella lausannensis]|uniref:Protein SirB1 N-terminal domain-containing protein n=1 Tax=Estrella lausannensis TaxID=483423 RepID=A0A0H5DSJ8_9BACT|nr:transglutaminase family protein [Estrella lausannensis]CRX39283.1 Conserved hypothetical protein [Estrella lausannensis]
MHLFILLIASFLLVGPSSPLLGEASPKLRAIYSSIPPKALLEHLAFYSLYPDSEEGKRALVDALKLAGAGIQDPFFAKKAPLLIDSLKHALLLIHRGRPEEAAPLTPEEVASIDKLAFSLQNRKLKGRVAQTEQEVLVLPPEEIDLARGLLLSQLGSESLDAIRSYEAVLDLMALSIRAKLKKNSAPKDVIHAINAFIFDEMGYRFPPLSSFEKKVDTYTFLSSVLDSRKGVCLGVSILYLCLADRLGIPMEIVTPPGHIFVRYRDALSHINIETTARGIHLDDEEYLSVGTKALQKRNVKEVIGLAHVNQASVFWETGELTQAMAYYKKAENYLPDDLLLKELMGYALFAKGEKEESYRLLQTVQERKNPYLVSIHTLVDDCLQGNATPSGVLALFMRVDETNESIAKKREALETALQESPRFKSALFALALNTLNEQKLKAGLKLLLDYHALYPEDPAAEYYLSMLLLMRYRLQESWRHLEIAEALALREDHSPRALKELRKELEKRCPKGCR